MGHLSSICGRARPRRRLGAIVGLAAATTGSLLAMVAVEGSPPAGAAIGDISRYAGTSLGDGGPATSAILRTPDSVAIDSSGNLYIADRANNRIRKVSTTGTISTVAGDGTSGFAGDGGPATDAVLGHPQGVAVDSAGNLYIADTDNNRVRKVSTTGTITTVAGSSNWLLGDGGPATSAFLFAPTAVATDGAGNLYIADTSNQRVRKVNTLGIISTVAGNGTAGFSGDGGSATLAGLNTPGGLAVDSVGNLFIADTGNLRVRRVVGSGTISTVAGDGTGGYLGDGGPATSAAVDTVHGLAFDAAGNLLLGSRNGTVRTVDTTGTITTVATGFANPDGLALDAAGNRYVAEQGANRVRKIDTTGAVTTVAGNGGSGVGDGGPATNALLVRPTGIAKSGNGPTYIADTANHRIRRVDGAGTITTFAGTGTAGSSGNGGQANGARLNQPGGVAVDALGNVYIADTGNHVVRKVETTGTITVLAGTGLQGLGGDGGLATSASLNQPNGVAVDPGGSVYIADTGNNRIRRVDARGIITTFAAGLSQPRGIAFDPGGNAFIADTGNGRIRKIELLGTATTFASGLNQPTGVVVDSTGNAYVAEQGAHRVRKITGAGVVTTIAGTGTAGYSGDGGSGLAALVNQPTGVALDDAGNVYFTDRRNDFVRKVAGVAAPLSDLGYPSDDCDNAPGSSNVANGMFGDTWVKLRTAPGGPGETWICTVQQSGGVHVGAKLIVQNAPTAPTVDDNSAACNDPATAGTPVFEQDPIVSPPIGRETHAFHLTVVAPTNAVWVCVHLYGGTPFDKRVLVSTATPTPGLTIKPDAPQPHGTATP